MNFELISFVVEIATVVFVASGTWFLVKQTRKDLNGLGQRVRDDRTAEDFRFWTAAVLQITLPEKTEDRKWLTERILEAGKRKL